VIRSKNVSSAELENSADNAIARGERADENDLLPTGCPTGKVVDEIITKPSKTAILEACRIRMDHWTGERSFLADRTFVLKRALAKEGDEGSLAALTTMLAAAFFQ
jgi:hypothetical protein